MKIEELRRLAAKEELSLNYIAKDQKISEILLNLQNINNIILKGGTAINRTFLKNKRFSEDIDLDFISNKTVKQSIQKTKEIVSKLDFKISRPRIMKEIIRYDLFYNNPLNHQDKIRIEFKIIKKASNYDKKIINFGFVPYDSALLNVYNLEELIKQKIECILNRTEGKDFFDLYYLIKLPHKKLKLPKEELIKKTNLEEKEIKSAANILNHYIPKNQRPNWIIFLEELKDIITNY